MDLGDSWVVKWGGGGGYGMRRGTRSHRLGHLQVVPLVESPRLPSLQPTAIVMAASRCNRSPTVSKMVQNRPSSWDCPKTAL